MLTHGGSLCWGTATVSERTDYSNSQMRFYEAFELEPALSIDADDLKKRFYERSRQWHPDRFGRASAEEQQKALDMTSALNDAFRILRDPASRGEYFFKESGVELSKQLPSGTLEEFFELNMALEELRAGDESFRPQLIEARDKYSGLLNEMGKQLTVFFELYDKYTPSERKIIIEPIQNLLNTRRYIANFLREVDKQLNVLPN
jgi:molecular chaperone HscB